MESLCPKIKFFKKLKIADFSPDGLSHLRIGPTEDISVKMTQKRAEKSPFSPKGLSHLRMPLTGDASVK